MSGAVVVFVGLIGVIAGLGVARIVGEVPDPSPLDRRATAIVAAINGGAWALVAHSFERWWVVVPYVLLASTLTCLSAIDVRVYRIPDRVLFPALGASLVLTLLASTQLAADGGAAWEAYRNGLLGAVVYFVILFIPHVVYPKGMGFGDVKLALLMGFFLGWGRADVADVLTLCLFALFLGCVLGVLSGAVVNIARRKGGAFPFGPALALACLFVVLYPERFLPT